MAGLDDYSGSFNDKLDQYLASLGLTGDLNDKLYSFTGYEGNVGQKLTAFYLGLVVFSSSLLLENSNYLLLENGDKLLLE